ncbi:hypothetical protein I3760_16G059600 [Carya illinoinensis]|nr:hypothetical protein I3760_16G059600 [Carya illinoinensis]
MNPVDHPHGGGEVGAPIGSKKIIRWYTIFICTVALLLITCAFYYHFQLDDPLMQLTEDYKWINLFDFYWRLGIDGLSIGPILVVKLYCGDDTVGEVLRKNSSMLG